MVTGKNILKSRAILRILPYLLPHGPDDGMLPSRTTIDTQKRKIGHGDKVSPIDWRRLVTLGNRNPKREAAARPPVGSLPAGWPTGSMAAAEEEARQKVLKELKEKNDMIINIKERKNEGPVLKYYAAPKFKPNAAEFDKEGYLPLHWACDAQAKNTIVDVLLEAYPDGAKMVTKGEGNGDLPLHLACMKTVTGDTAKALAARIESMGLMITSMIKAYPEACAIKQRGVIPMHLACTYQAPIGALQAHIDQYPQGCSVPADGTGNLPLHLACLKGSSEEVIVLLVQTYPDACKVRAHASRS